MARLLVTQNNYGLWTWSLVGRESGYSDMASQQAFDSREDALEAGKEVCGDEATFLAVDGVTPGTEAIAPPLPTVNPAAERKSAGVPEPDTLMH